MGARELSLSAAVAYNAAMALDAGELDRRIEVEIATKGVDSSNDEIITWALAFKRWAKKREAAGREFMASQQVIRDADTSFTVRFDSQTNAIAPETHRIRYADAIYEIVGIGETNDARRDGILIQCCSRPDAGGARGRQTTSDGSP